MMSALIGQPQELAKVECQFQCMGISFSGSSFNKFNKKYTKRIKAVNNKQNLWGENK